jgi:hypothetical protein
VYFELPTLFFFCVSHTHHHQTTHLPPLPIATIQLIRGESCAQSVLSLALHMSTVVDHASVRFVPLSLDAASVASDSRGDLLLPRGQFWEAAALLAAAIDTATSGYRATATAHRAGLCTGPCVWCIIMIILQFVFKENVSILAD